MCSMEPRSTAASWRLQRCNPDSVPFWRYSGRRHARRHAQPGHQWGQRHGYGRPDAQWHGRPGQQQRRLNQRSAQLRRADAGWTGTIVFGSWVGARNRINTANNNGDSGTLTIGSGITITGQTGFIGYDGGENQTPLINQGTIDANVGNGAIEVFGSNWSNTGTIGARAGAASFSMTRGRTAERLPTAAAESISPVLVRYWIVQRDGRHGLPGRDAE